MNSAPTTSGPNEESNVPALVLLNEVLNDQGGSERASEQSSDGDNLVSENLASNCFTLGPFRSESDADKALTLLARAVEKPVLRQRVEQQQWGYRVLVPARHGFAEARAYYDQLTRKGIKDYYIITEGKNLNGISLGHFKEKKHAMRREEEIRNLGFPVRMEPVFREYTLYWLDYELADDRTGDAELTAVFEAFQGINKLNRTCE